MSIKKWNEITDGPLLEFDEAGRHFMCADLALSRHGIKYTTLRKHCRLGSPLLPDNRKPRKHTVSITSKNGTRTREYFDEADLTAMKAPRAYPAGYIDGRQAYDDFGFVVSFLWKWSRERHPALSRPIRSKLIVVAGENQTSKGKLYRQEDLETIRDWMGRAVEVSGSRLTTSQAVDAGIDVGRLKHLRKSKRIRSHEIAGRTRNGHARIIHTHNASDVKLELKIISDAKYGMHVDHEGITWRSRSNASGAYNIPAVTLDGYANGAGTHGKLRVEDVPILMKGNRRQRDYVKTQPGFNDEDLKRIAESRKTFGKLPVLRRDGHDWLAAAAAAAFTGVGRRRLHALNAVLGAKKFEVQAGPWRGKAWHYRKDKLIEHFPGIAEDPTPSSDKLLPLVKGLHVKHDALHAKADGLHSKIEQSKDQIITKISGSEQQINEHTSKTVGSAAEETSQHITKSVKSAVVQIAVAKNKDLEVSGRPRLKSTVAETYREVWAAYQKFIDDGGSAKAFYERPDNKSFGLTVNKKLIDAVRNWVKNNPE